LWALRHGIKAGDLIVQPLKSQPGYLAFGRCKGGYQFDASQSNPEHRHFLPVNWSDQMVARSMLKDDLLNMINGAMTVFRPSKNNAAARLEVVARGEPDPGASAPENLTTHPVDTALSDGGTADVSDPVSVATLEGIRDRIRAHIIENFSGHKLTNLLADILEGLGFRCEVSPAGPDGGVDILAGRGPLGLDSPTLIVEVKSEPGAVGASVVRSLHSAMTQHRADQGLLVAWGGISNPARREFTQQRTQLRIWDAEQLLDQLFSTYDRLPATTRARIPLKQAWVLDTD
jgi:restriction system protein